MEREPAYNIRDRVVVIDLSTGSIYSGERECDIFKGLPSQEACSNCIVMYQWNSARINKEAGGIGEPRVEIEGVVGHTELRAIAQALLDNGCSSIFQVHYREENKWVIKTVQDILGEEA